MTASDLLARLEGLGVKLVAEGDRLRANAAAPGILNDELRLEISANKSKLLELLTNRVSSRTPLERVSREGILPLSSFQERLWIIQTLEPENTAFLLAATWWAPTNSNVSCYSGRYPTFVVATRDLDDQYFRKSTELPSLKLLGLPKSHVMCSRGWRRRNKKDASTKLSRTYAARTG